MASTERIAEENRKVKDKAKRLCHAAHDLIELNRELRDHLRERVVSFHQAKDLRRELHKPLSHLMRAA